jgi:transcription elongation factor GreA
MDRVDRITMTAEELERAQRELGRLETDGRREMAGRIKTAREFGDLKENAEYHAAKEDQARLETRIAKLREQIRSAVVTPVTASADTVQHGSTVSYTDRSTNRHHTSRIVSPHDARPAEGALSSASPVAKALIGRGVGDVIEVTTPAGVRTLLIDAIT